MKDRLTQGDAVPAEQAADAPGLSAAPAMAAAPTGWPLTVYPAATRLQLALLLMALSAFLAGVLLFSDSPAAMWLCGLLAVNGAAVAFFGLVQQLTWNGKLFWQVTLSQGGAPFGPYVNRNNAGGYLLICLGAAMALASWALQRNRKLCRNRYLPEDHPAAGGSGRRASRIWRLVCRWGLDRPLQRAAATAGEVLRSLDGFAITAIALAGCIAAGVFCSLSRGAIVSLGGAAVAMIALLLLRRRRGGTSLVALALAGGIGLVAWVGMTEAVQSRLATLLDEHQRDQARLPHWGDSAKLVADFAATGCGLGTYRFAYRPYQERLSRAWYLHAENQYLEALAEGGVLGLALLLAAIVLVACAGLRLLSCKAHTRAFALGFGGLFALFAQAIHACFDFGLYMPANFLALALLCGAVCGRADRLAKEQQQDSPAAGTQGASRRGRKLGISSGVVERGSSRRRPRGWLVRGIPALATGAMVAAGVWGLGQVQARAAVERALRSARFSQPPEEVSAAAVDQAIGQLDAALARRPDDAEAQHCMATLYLRRYRAEALGELCREYPQADRQTLWQATSQIVLHGRAHQFLRSQQAELLEALRDHPIVARSLRSALAHLLAAHQACPLVPEVGLSVAELAWLAGDPAADRPWLDHVRRLAVSDPDQLFHCGLLAFDGGHRELAWASWKQGLSLSANHLEDVLQLAFPVAEPEELAAKVLPDQPPLLIRLAESRLAGQGNRPDEPAADRRLGEAVLARAEQLLQAGDCGLELQERLYWQAAAHRLGGRDDQAAVSLSQAVGLAPDNAQWRYELAMLLRQQGRLEDAHQQAVVSARLAPANRQYRQLLEQINHTRVAGPSRPEEAERTHTKRQ